MKVATNLLQVVLFVKIKLSVTSNQNALLISAEYPKNLRKIIRDLGNCCTSKDCSQMKLVKSLIQLLLPI